MKELGFRTMVVLFVAALVFAVPFTVMGQEWETETEVAMEYLSESDREVMGLLRGNLPYVQSRDLMECIDIMGRESSAYCFQVVLGEEPAPRSAPYAGSSAF